MTYEEALAVATANNEIDENQTFLIDKNLRTVTIPDGFVLGVFNDKNVQIVPFAMPRYYNGIDMSTFAIQVNYVNSAGDGDIYLVFDQDVQEDLILFDWVVDRTAFATSGRTGFVVCMKEDDEYGYVAREFNTTLAYAPVLDGLEIDNPIDDQEVLDVLTQIRRAAERADIAALQAEDSAAQASTDATTASNAATSASTSADTATAAQQSASASATTATNAETNALAYRNAAAASAAEAAAVVTDIEDVLSFPNALVVESATSEDIVTIEDGADNIPMTSVLATMNPIQDLNGYDKPWSGGGKNLLNNTAQTTTVYGITWTVNSDGTVTANGTATADSQFGVVIGADELPRETNLYFSGCPSGGSASKYNVYIWDNTTNARAKKWNNITAVDNDTGASANNELYLTSNHEYKYNMRVMSGQTVSNIVFSPMIRRTTGSDGTFAPYSNICPISGRTGLAVTKAGKNILNPSAMVRGSVFVDNGDGTYTFSKTGTGASGRITWSSPITADDGTTVTFSANITGTHESEIYVGFALNETTGGASAECTISNGRITGTVTSTGYMNGIRLYWRNNSAGVGTYSVVLSNMQVEYGSAVTDYEAPSITTIPITWESIAGTVYGGTLDVVSGVLTVDRAMVEFDGSSDETWTALTTEAVFRHNAPTPLASVEKRTQTITNETNVTTYSYSTMKDNYPSISFDTNSRLFLAISDEYTTVAQCREWLAANPLQVCYYLATPQTYQLTPTEVRTLLGINNLWSDGDSMTAKYRADLKMYIDKKIAEAIA